MTVIHGPDFDRRALIATLAASLTLSATFGPATAQPDLAQAAGSMLLMGFWGASPDSAGARAIADLLAAGRIGGVILFDENLASPSAARDLIGFLKSSCKGTTPLIAVDQEGGAVVRLLPQRGFHPLPAAKILTGMPDSETLRLYGQTARELHDLGINLNFGPVVDLDVNPRNPIIGALGRSYGADPARVIAEAKLFVDAHRSAHVLTALKHFPGHGSAGQDSHRALPDITGLWHEEELKPFAALVGSGYADMIMVGHLTDRNLTEAGRPASLSPRVIHGLLRTQIGFDGVVVSDDMQMGALRRSYAPDDSIALGIEAGVDLFVFSNREHPDPEMPERFHRVVKTMIAAGRIVPERITLSAQRIAALKRSLT
ncbi:glycoside hydrolase family 3 N-terminal domain-containing protein [Lichenifustis flavocetrariae]|uniref:beta-N-acetylhexosaminidase n=1 Tax=Lichenifustis flavocetrariae TaxID=2949735 RepID=A0AA41YZK9_9HYPH|nr:glycoside hydrolase family 3 N-terminal domain-containing protein [Lichenifustis flavocetrariae]MCW6506597.1 glycoside hydrolase family 3 protein [Lichenifustis flavocetrariae]